MYWQYQRIDATTARLFDSVRGASALIVVIAHAAFYWLDGFFPSLAPYLLRMATLAVMAFFVVSGFMITSSILRRLNQTSFKRFDVRAFGIDRLRRLLPPLAAALLIMLVSYGVLIQLHQGYTDYWSVRQALGALLFIQDMRVGFPVALVNGPLWSLSHEFWFYVVAALLASMLFRPLLAGMLLTGLFVGWAMLGSISIRWLLGLAVWMSGAGLALWYHRGSQPSVAEQFARQHRVRFAIHALLVTAMVWWTVVSDAGIGRYIVGWLLALSLFVVLRGGPPLPGKEPSSRQSDGRQEADGRPVSEKKIAFDLCSGINNFSTLVAAVAPFSYTLYVVHFPLVLLWNVLTERWQHSFPGVLLVCLTGLAGILWLAKMLAGYVEDKQRFVHSV